MEKYSVEQVADIIETEGFGYAIYGYLNADKIADPVLSEKWRLVQNTMTEIEAYIKERVPNADF